MYAIERRVKTEDIPERAVKCRLLFPLAFYLINRIRARLSSLNRNFPNTNILTSLQEITRIELKLYAYLTPAYFHSCGSTSLSRLVIRKCLFDYLVIMLSVIIGNYSMLTC